MGNLSLSNLIEIKLREKLQEMKNQGHKFISDEEIDKLFEESYKKSQEERNEIKTIGEIKELVASHFTSGKHTWDDGYLTRNIRLKLMDDVAEIYANQFKNK